jgi:hypothetical protein
MNMLVLRYRNVTKSCGGVSQEPTIVFGAGEIRRSKDICHKLSPSETVAKRERLNILAKKLVLLFPRCQKSWASRSGELRLHPGDISRPAQLFIQHKSHRGVLMKCDHSREGVRFNYIP